MAGNEQGPKGRQGEKELDLLAEYAGFTVQKPTEDLHGWDQLWELKAPDDASVPIDRRPGILNVLVQAKATDSRAYESVKLDVLERAAKDSRPFFFAFVIRGADRRPTDFYLVHVDEPKIFGILKRLRQADADGKRNDIHRQTMRIGWKDGHRVSPGDSDGLRRFIVNEVGDPAAYAEKKLRLVETLGYEDGTHQARVTFNRDVTNEDVVDLWIGARPSLQVKAMEVSDMRFGIHVPTAKYMKEGGLSVKPQSMAKVLVTLESDKGKRVEMFLDLFAAPGAVPLKNWKMRLANAVVEFVIYPEAERMNVKVDCPDECALEDLEAGADMFSLLREGPSELRIAVLLPTQKVWEARCEAPKMNAPQSLQTALRGAKACAGLALRSGFRVSQERVYLENIEQIADSLDTLLSSLGSMTGEGTLIPDHPDGGIFQVESAAFLFNVALPFTKQIISLVGSIEGQPRRVESDGKIKLVVSGTVSILAAKRLPRSEFKVANPVFLQEVLDAEDKKRPQCAFFATWKGKSVVEDEMKDLPRPRTQRKRLQRARSLGGGRNSAKKAALVGSS